MSDYTDDAQQPDELIGELSDADPVERAVFFALDDAAGKLDEQGDFEPFLIIVQGDDVHIEELTGDDEDAIIAQARQTVFQMSKVAEAYILTYNGFVELEDSASDAIILEYALPDAAEASVLAWLYEEHNGHMHYTEPLYSLGSAPSLFDPPVAIELDTDSSSGLEGGSEAATVDGATAASSAAAGSAATSSAAGDAPSGNGDDSLA